jgi:type 1 glutamine amidotransferase
MNLKRTIILSGIALCATASPFLGAQSPAAQTPTTPAKIRVLILSGSSDYAHPWLTTTIYLQQALMNTGRFDAKIEEEVPGITAATLANYDVLLNYYQGPRWGDATEHAVDDFLKSGKGMFAMHASLFGPLYGQIVERGGFRMGAGEPWPQYADMLGENWPVEDHTHARRRVFTVQWVDRDSPISKGLPSAFMADDELYRKITLKPNAHVLATAYDDPNIPRDGGTGKMEPMVWTVPYGQGRVVVTTLGHDLLSISQPGFTDLLVRGIEWAATGAVKPMAVVPPQPAGGAQPPKL